MSQAKAGRSGCLPAKALWKVPTVPLKCSSIETSYSWIRLLVLITLSTLGCVGMWSLAVALPAVQADFGVHRAEASLPYALTIIGFMIGGIIVGRFADRLRHLATIWPVARS